MYPTHTFCQHLSYICMHVDNRTPIVILITQQTILGQDILNLTEYEIVF